MERKGGNRWRTLRLGIAMKEHQAIEREGEWGGEGERKKERARKNAKGRWVGRKGVRRRGNFHDVAARILWSP